MCHPRILKSLVRVLMCILVMSMVQPNLILCFGQDGKVRMESSSCSLFASAGSAFNPCCLSSSSDDQPCGSCEDVPISMHAIRAGSSQTHSAGMAKATLYSSLAALLPQPSGISLQKILTWPAQADDFGLSTIRATVLLI
jgi:hypothetical protein